MRKVLMIAAMLPALAPACMWDSDTLAEEASLGGDFIRTISGRFPRNPPLYYRMRRDRILARGPKTPGDFDDLAVACDRLGDSLEALKWIDRKPKGDEEVSYRTHANRGTFLVHAWLAGKKGEHAGRQGLWELQEAVRINPDAHFGRERSQIKLVEALLDPKGAVFETDFRNKAAARREAEGYAGIVRLGSGWESPDVFRVLATDLAGARLGAVATQALLRADEIEAAGHKARFPKEEHFPLVLGSQSPELRDDTREQFRWLREEADAWQARRTGFMLARLKEGRHPDTDPRFWEGWKDTPPPKVEGPWRVDLGGLRISPYLLAGVLLALVATLAVPILLIRWALRRWRLRVRIRPS